MQRTRLVLSAMSFAVALAILLLALLAPADPRVNVRWVATATVADRFYAGEKLHLNEPDAQGERTWSYSLSDDSTTNIARLVGHPLVEDTHNIDRARFTITPEFPPIRASLRELYRRGPLNAVSRSWPALTAMFIGAGLVLAWPVVGKIYRADHRRLVLPAILLASLVIRLVLIGSGGQFYWPDEGRYQDVRDDVAAAAMRSWTMKSIDDPAHLLFKVLGAIPAAVELLRGEDSRIPATFFALFSVLNIWLLVTIARRLQAGVTASLVAGTIFALSSSMFYFSRHLLPYDVAMTFGLIAVLAGSAHQPTWRASIACGVWAACAFLAYAGYWTLGGASCLLHVCLAENWRDAARRAMLAGFGLASTLGAASLLYGAVAASPFQKLVAFAGTITQGRYDEGWRLPLEYLWHTEHLLLVLWLVSLAWCLITWRWSWEARSIRAGLVGVAFVYVTLAMCSVVFNLFVVYGRLARQLVPFLCLLTATVLVRAWKTRPAAQRTGLAVVASAFLAVQAMVNFSQPLRQPFPREFVRRVEALAATAGASETTTQYAHHIYPVPEPFTMARGATVLALAPHPLQFLPYQYEGFSRAERHQLRSTDIRMRAVIPARIPSTEGAGPR
jgi:hypothetical protein